MASFSKFKVTAGSAIGEWCLHWEVDCAEMLAARVYVYRSVDAVNWGDPINTDSPVQFTTSYLDKYRPALDDDDVYYRLTAVLADGTLVDSRVSDLYEDLTRKQQGMLRKILNLELRGMRDAQDGYRAFLFKPLLAGTRCPDCQDAGTDVASQTSICRGCYGTGWVGGYADPVETWVKRKDGDQTKREDLPGNAGSETENTASFRTMAHPKFRPNDVVLVPADDTAWVIGSTKTVLFRGIVPLMTEATAVKLRTGDVRNLLATQVR